MSENSKVHLNTNMEMQTEIKGVSDRDNCDMDNKNTDVIAEAESITETNHTLKLGNEDDNSNKTARTGTPDINDQNINTDLQNNVLAEKSPANCDEGLESGGTKCDMCSAVDVENIENITNSLAEKVNIENAESSSNPEVEVAKCDKPIVEMNTEKNITEAVLCPDKLVNKVKELVISGVTPRVPSQIKSTVILKKETASLKNLLTYDSSSNDESDLEQDWQCPASDKSESESDTDDSDDDSESSDEDEDDAGSTAKKVNAKDQQMNLVSTEDVALKIYSENNINDLPPIRDVSNLDIDVEKEDFLHMGHIEAIIETLVTIEALPGIPAYDLDTCLFVEDKTVKRPLGAVYDVIGPVAAPLYCIRFQSASDIAHLNLKKGVKVFCAPKSKHTKYVFVSELLRIKGSDASWVGDVELPPEVAAELSDDEGCEPEIQEARKAQKRKHGSQERHKQFEDNMNRNNMLNSHAVRIIDAQQSIPRMSRYNDHIQRALFNDVIAQSHRLPPSFDPSVPPPGFYGFSRSQPVRAPMLWEREQRMVPQRPPRCHSVYRPSHYPNNYTNNDMGHGPGTSSHPY